MAFHDPCGQALAGLGANSQGTKRGAARVLPSGRKCSRVRASGSRQQPGKKLRAGHHQPPDITSHHFCWCGAAAGRSPSEKRVLLSSCKGAHRLVGGQEGQTGGRTERGRQGSKGTHTQTSVWTQHNPARTDSRRSAESSRPSCTLEGRVETGPGRAWRRVRSRPATGTKGSTEGTVLLNVAQYASQGSEN